MPTIIYSLGTCIKYVNFTNHYISFSSGDFSSKFSHRKSCKYRHCQVFNESANSCLFLPGPVVTLDPFIIICHITSLTNLPDDTV